MRPAGFHHTEETKQKMTLNHGRWNKGLTKDCDERVRNQSITLSIHWQKTPHPKGMLGKQHSPQTKELMSQKRQGSRNSNWRGGRTRLMRKFRHGTPYLNWRKKVLERDNHTCVVCGNKENVQAHHILPAKDYPELRLEVSNGQTRCKTCHKEEHHHE